MRLGLSRVFLRSRVAESTVRTFFVVVPPPSFDLVPRIIQAEEPMLVEAFLPEPAVEGLDIGVVRRLPGMTSAPSNPGSTALRLTKRNQPSPWSESLAVARFDRK